MQQGELSLKHWRKSAQWASLTRKHAQIVSDDVAVADVFAKHCRVGTNKKTGHVYKCIADEVSSWLSQSRVIAGYIVFCCMGLVAWDRMGPLD